MEKTKNLYDLLKLRANEEQQNLLLKKNGKEIETKYAEMVKAYQGRKKINNSTLCYLFYIKFGGSYWNCYTKRTYDYFKDISKEARQFNYASINFHNKKEKIKMVEVFTNKPEETIEVLKKINWFDFLCTPENERSRFIKEKLDLYEKEGAVAEVDFFAQDKLVECLEEIAKNITQTTEQATRLTKQKRLSQTKISDKKKTDKNQSKEK